MTLFGDDQEPLVSDKPPSSFRGVAALGLTADRFIDPAEHLGELPWSWRVDGLCQASAAFGPGRIEPRPRERACSTVLDVFRMWWNKQPAEPTGADDADDDDPDALRMWWDAEPGTDDADDDGEPWLELRDRRCDSVACVKCALLTVGLPLAHLRRRIEDRAARLADRSADRWDWLDVPLDDWRDEVGRAAPPLYYAEIVLPPPGPARKRLLAALAAAERRCARRVEQALPAKEPDPQRWAQRFGSVHVFLGTRRGEGRWRVERVCVLATHPYRLPGDPAANRGWEALSSQDALAVIKDEVLVVGAVARVPSLRGAWKKRPAAGRVRPLWKAGDIPADHPDPWAAWDRAGRLADAHEQAQLTAEQREALRGWLTVGFGRDDDTERAAYLPDAVEQTRAEWAQRHGELHAWAGAADTVRDRYARQFARRPRRT